MHISIARGAQANSLAGTSGDRRSVRRPGTEIGDIDEADFRNPAGNARDRRVRGFDDGSGRQSAGILCSVPGLGIPPSGAMTPAYGLPGYYNDHKTAWKVIAGVRPISILGAEFEYIDFGQPRPPLRPPTTPTPTVSTHIRARRVLFGVGYLPLPIPFIDIYGKAGVARLQTDVTTTLRSCAVQAQIAWLPPTYSRHSETDSKFAYGVGVQSKAWGFAISRRVRADQLAVRRSGRPDGQRHLDVLRTLCCAGFRRKNGADLDGVGRIARVALLDETLEPLRHAALAARVAVVSCATNRDLASRRRCRTRRPKRCNRRSTPSS